MFSGGWVTNRAADDDRWIVYVYIRVHVPTGYNQELHVHPTRAAVVEREINLTYCTLTTRLVYNARQTTGPKRF